PSRDEPDGLLAGIGSPSGNPRADRKIVVPAMRPRSAGMDPVVHLTVMIAAATAARSFGPASAATLTTPGPPAAASGAADGSAALGPVQELVLRLRVVVDVTALGHMRRRLPLCAARPACSRIPLRQDADPDRTRTDPQKALPAILDDLVADLARADAERLAGALERLFDVLTIDLCAGFIVLPPGPPRAPAAAGRRQALPGASAARASSAFA